MPIPKARDCHNKAMPRADFRGIAINPVLSKVFEYCLLDRCKSLLHIVVISLTLRNALVVRVNLVFELEKLGLETLVLTNCYHVRRV